MYVFISHSSADAQYAAEVCECLERNQIECFIAPRDIRPGREYAEELINGIDCSQAMVLLMSKAANQSPHVLREIERAVSKNIPILVYKLEDVVLSKSMEYFLMTHQWISKQNQGDYTEILSFVKNLEKSRHQEPEQSVQQELKTQEKSKKTLLYTVMGITAVAVLAIAVVFAWNLGRQNKLKPSETVESSGSMADTSDNAQNQKEPGNSTVMADSYQVGDYLTLGTYNGKPIEWRVLRIEDAENEKHAILIAKNILSIKAFDAAESGWYNEKDGVSYFKHDSEADRDLELQAFVRGNSDWSESNIRTWLNSTAEVVAYKNGVPMSDAMSEHKNGYQNEPGFLNGFTKEELLKMRTRKNETEGNALKPGEVICTEDMVFFLSEQEIQWFAEAELSPLAAATEEAKEADAAKWYRDYEEYYKVETYYWWLRDPVEGYSSKGKVFGTGYGTEGPFDPNNIYPTNAGVEGYGIRPAIVIAIE